MTISPPDEYSPSTFVGFEVGSEGFGGAWYWMFPWIVMLPDAAMVVCFIKADRGTFRASREGAHAKNF